MSDERREAAGPAGALSDSRARRQQACYQVMFESSGVGMAIALPDGQIREANTALASFLGYSPEDLVRLHMSEVVHPEDLPLALESLGELLAGRIAHVRAANRWIRKDGSEVWGGVWVTLVPDGAPGEREILVIVEDESDRRRAEQELADRDRRLKLALEAADNGLWDWDILSGQVTMSRAWLRSVGHGEERERAAIEFWIDLVHPEDRAQAGERVREHLRGESPYHDVELRMRTGTGGYIWVEHRGRVVEWGASGEPRRAMGLVRDITARRRVEDALRRSEARYRGMMESQKDLITRTDLGGRLVFVNGAFCHKFGRRRSELIGAPLLPFVHPEDREQSLAAYAALANPPHRVGVEHRARTAEGWRWLSWELVGILGEHGYVIEYQSVGRDVTEYREALAALQVARDEAEAANRAKSEFLANMSHEIRTPMTSILGFASLAEEPGASAAERRAHLATIRRNGEHLLTIINDILDLSRVESGQMEVVRALCSIGELVEEFCASLRPRAEEQGICLRCEYSGALPESVQTDPVRLRQILLNLVGNAIKFTPEGEVVVGVSLAEGQGGASPALHICVRDSGIGVAPEHMPRLFAPFSQGDESLTRRYGGTGLGLAISQRLAHVLGGEIAVESAPGRGSTFTLRLPLESGRAGVAKAPFAGGEPRTSAPAPTIQSLGKLSGRVLLADDREDNRTLYRIVMERWGLSVLEARDGREAVEIWRAGEAFDLVLMDLQMPEMDGYQAAQALREEGCLVPILALSAHAMEGERERTEAAGFDGYASKPIAHEALFELLGASLMAARRNAGGWRSGRSKDDF